VCVCAFKFFLYLYVLERQKLVSTTEAELGCKNKLTCHEGIRVFKTYLISAFNIVTTKQIKHQTSK
jgi:hypothetical protein